MSSEFDLCVDKGYLQCSAHDLPQAKPGAQVLAINRDKVEAAAIKLLQQGKTDEAKKLAYKAQALHGPYSFWESGDRPARLLEDIHRVELSRAAKAETEGKPDPITQAQATQPAFQQPVNQVAKAPPVAPAPVNTLQIGRAHV